MEMTNEVSQPLEGPGRWMRMITTIVLVVFTLTSVAPSAHAFAGTADGIFGGLGNAKGTGSNDEEERYARFFREVREHAGLLAGKADKYGRLPGAAQQEEARDNLGDLLDELDDIESAIEDEFDDVGKLVRSKDLPKTIRARHATAFASIAAEFAAVRRDIRQVRNERDDKKRRVLAEGLHRRLDSSRFERSQQDFDPNDLPNSALKPDTNNTPRLTEDAYIATGLVGNPLRRVAQAGGFTFATLPGANDPAYLVATDEILLTADITAKAAALGNEPVRIYEWVHDNIHWAPTWGAIQDASHTLSSQRGNAFDIASLTIALLRASGYPARYVHGTIDVPEAAFRNWVGGFQNINAAMEFASAGGIPLGPVTASGRVTKVRMEHVWVEAALDFHPSRGARNFEADTWVAMDPAFKQLQITQGIDLVQASGANVSQIAADFAASGTSNAALGAVSGVDLAVLQTAANDAQTAVLNYVAQAAPATTVGVLLGARTIVATPVRVLPTGLPNRVVTTGARYGSLPAALQQRVTFAFGKDVLGDPVNGQTFAWSRMNNRRITLSFRPATADDEATLRALLPIGAANIMELPDSVPGYLVNVVPQLKVDEQVVMSGAPVALGTEINFVFNPRFAGRQEKQFSYRVPAGSFLAVGAFAGSLSPARLAASQQRLAATQSLLQSETPFSLEAGQLFDDLFTTALQVYYGQYVGLSAGSGRQVSAYHQLAAGLGTLGTEIRVDSVFGVPRRARTGDIVLNLPIVNVVGVDSASGNSAGFTTHIGAISSALEHMVPEQTLLPPGSTVTGVSAVKALALALQSGQTTYRVSAANQAAVLPLINQDPQTLAEIRGALAAGREVITHSNPVSVPGWTGAGYVILDTDTGSAAWKISGGANGDFLKWVDENSIVLGIVSVALAAIGAAAGFAILATIAVLIGIAITVAGIYMFEAETEDGPCKAPMVAMYAMINVAFLALGALGGPIVFALIAFLYGVIATEPIRQIASLPVCQGAGGPREEDP